MIAAFQKTPSVATVTAHAHGPTMATNRISPQPQPRVVIHLALRSQIESPSTVRITTIGPMGPLTKVATEIANQKMNLVSRGDVFPSRWLA